MKKTRQSILFAIITLLLSSCEMLRQIEEMKTLSKCEFRIHTVTDIQLAGINISKIQSLTDIRPPDILQLTNAAFNNQLPLNFILNLQVNNPNQQVASINHLEWILFIDEMQMLNGAIRETFSAGPGENVTLPVNIVFNLAEVLKGERGEKIIDFALALADGTGKTDRVMVKLKPSIMMGGRRLMYPGWIEVRNDFVAS